MDKLQELTQKLYNEGLSKGKEEGEAILAKAREEAEALLNKARKEAEELLAAARKEALDHKVKVEGDVKMAASQALQTTRAEVENLIVAKATAPVKDILAQEDFLKEIISTVAARFSAEESTDLSLILPENLRNSLEPFVKEQLGKTIGKGVEASFSKKIGGGFQIGPKDGSYFISLTDDSFRSLISEYLRPATKELLFGTNE